MQRVYQRSMTTLVYHSLIALVATVFAFVITYSLTHTTWIAGLIALAVLAAAAGMTLSGAKLQIMVDDTSVTFMAKGKTHCHELAQCSFSSVIRDNSDLTLTVCDGGESYFYDCSYIGLGQYQRLLEDLGVAGEKLEVRKIETRKER